MFDNGPLPTQPTEKSLKVRQSVREEHTIKHYDVAATQSRFPFKFLFRSPS